MKPDEPTPTPTPGEAKPDSIAGDLVKTADALKRGKEYHVEKAMQYGVAHDAITGIQKLNYRVPGYLKPHAEAILKFRVFAEEKEKQQGRFDISSNAISVVGTSTVAGIGRTSEEVEEFLTNFIQPPSFADPARARGYAARLATLDPELGRLFLGVAEAFYGSIENPEREAMGDARQLFDHLFGALIQDDDAVRRSEFFQEKKGRDPGAVSRVERVKYAAATKVKDKAQAELLIAQAAGLVEVYRELQRLHERDALDRWKTRPILQTFMASIEQWVDAMEL